MNQKKKKWKNTFSLCLKIGYHTREVDGRNVNTLGRFSPAISHNVDQGRPLKQILKAHKFKGERRGEQGDKDQIFWRENENPDGSSSNEGKRRKKGPSEGQEAESIDKEGCFGMV